jgi:hypothetical protein
MPTETAYEHGARKLEPRTGPDPSDDFSQEAAENKKPPLGMGLTETGPAGAQGAKPPEPRPVRDSRDSPSSEPDADTHSA